MQHYVILETDIDTPAYHRIRKAGFHIDMVHGSYQGTEAMMMLGIEFTCVCKRKEMLMTSMDGTYYSGHKIDAARIIENSGALSVEHLREDGYSEEQISYIRRAYDTEPKYIDINKSGTLAA